MPSTAADIGDDQLNNIRVWGYNSAMHTSTQQLSNKAEDMFVKHTNTTQMKQVHGSALSSRITTQLDKEVNNVCTNSFLP